MKRVHFLLPAELEMLEAARYYESRAEIVTVMHLHRPPDYWIDRIDDGSGGPPAWEATR